MNIIVTGAGGRMGKKVCALDGVNVVCAVDPNLDIKSISECSAPADGIIDFSYHGAAPEICGYAVSHGLPVVFATTGHTPDELEAIKSAARSVPVFMSANMSLGIAVLCDFAKKAAAVFPDADIEIVETHHNRKLDAPSGTANEAYDRGTPRFCSVTRSVTGRVPTEERETNASWMAGQAPANQRSGERPWARSRTG